MTEFAIENETTAWPDNLGVVRPVSARDPFVLSGPNRGWYVSCGEVHLFLHEVVDGLLQSSRIPLFSVEQGGLIVGFPPPQPTDSWVIAGTASLETSLVSFSLDTFHASLEHNQTRGEGLLRQWLQQLGQVAGEWSPTDGPEAGQDEAPLPARVEIDLANARFQRWALTLVEQTASDWQASFRRREQAKKNIMETAFATMKDTIEGTARFSFDPQADTVLNACNLVLNKLGVSGKAPLKNLPTISGLTNMERVRMIAENSGFRIRKIALDRGAWWQQNGTPMVAFKEEDDQAVALLPTDKQSYQAVEPQGRRTVRVDKSYAGTLQANALAFYRPFPAKSLGFVDLLKFSLHDGGWDIFSILAWGAVVALLAMIPPIATSQVFNAAIPHADRGLLLQMLVILVACGAASWAISVVQSLCIVRFTSRADYLTQAAVWDRLLSLPTAFFRDFSVGDLADRAMSITKIKQTISATVITGIITGIFSVTSVIMMLYYAWQLALTAVFLISCFAILSAVVAYLIFRHQVTLANKEGELSGLTLQLFSGIAKLRSTNAEKEAFLKWVTLFKQKKQAYRQSGIWQMSLQALGRNLQLFIMIALFWVYFIFLRGEVSGSKLSSGSFMAFYSAYGSFQAAVLALLQGVFITLHCVPQYRRLAPILAAEPEMAQDKPMADQIKGQIAVNNVSFRYSPEGPLIVTDVSMQVLPGQFVAIVGDSGSGKSTLLRLLLGFDFPEEGSILYDANDLTKIDLRGLRRQIGVVLQNGKILQGSIFENIVGGSALLTQEDAWEAARLAGCFDDIKAMPMGMHTVVTAGGGTLSGGQRQRIMIARAIVSRPKILFFDEATSALDNRTQKIVSDSLEQLQATRIVIAHRLSTIEHADRIYVLERGKLIEEGSYQELMDRKGSFANLAKRQLT